MLKITPNKCIIRPKKGQEASLAYNLLKTAQISNRCEPVFEGGLDEREEADVGQRPTGESPKKSRFEERAHDAVSRLLRKTNFTFRKRDKNSQKMVESKQNHILCRRLPIAKLASFTNK